MYENVLIIISLSVAVGDPCDLPMSQGVGAGVLPRWYFSSAARQCIEFTYRGSLGNDNNFLSAENCERDCPGESKNWFFPGNLI